MIDKLVWLLLLIIPIIVYYLSLKCFKFFAEKDPFRALISIFILAFVWYCEFFVGVSAGAYLLYAIVGILIFLKLFYWTLEKPPSKISKKRKCLYITCILFFFTLSPIVFWKALDSLPISTRGKYPQAKSKIRNLAVSLETYYIDNNAYPPALNETGFLAPELNSKHGFPCYVGYVSWMLTTPIAHTESIPPDPFHNKETVGWERNFRYAVNELSYWILVSRGPDQDWDMDLEAYILEAEGDITKFLTQYGGTAVEYDPTNGTKSSGDVFRTGP